MIDLTFEDLFYFALKHKGNAFASLKPLQIAYELQKGLKDNCLWYNETEGNITGFLLFEVDNNSKTIFIKALVSKSFNSVKSFASEGLRLYPEYKLMTFRHGIKREFQPAIIHRKVMSYGRL